MKTIYKKARGIIAVLLLSAVPFLSFGQQFTTITVEYGPGGFCSFCNPPIISYVCNNNNFNFNNGNATFIDPLPAGNVIVSVSAVAFDTDCNNCSPSLNINADVIGSWVIPGNICFCGVCHVDNVGPATSFPAYNYGGVNTLQIVPNGGCLLCIDAVDLTFEYVLACPDDYVTVTPNDPAITCLLQPETLVATTTAGEPPYSFEWSPGGETTQSITVFPLETTTFQVKVTDDDGCVEIDTVIVAVKDFCGSDEAKALICHIPGGEGGSPNTICVDHSSLEAHLDDFKALHGGDHCGPCQFFKNGDPITNGNYSGDNLTFDAYPSPIIDKATIQFTLDYDSYVTLGVYNTAGALVSSIFNDFVVEGELNTIKFEASELATGMYIYKLYTDSETYIDQLVVTK